MIISQDVIKTVTTKNEKTLQTTNRPVVDKKHEMSILQKIKERFGVHTYSEKGEKDMTKVVEFLQANPVQYLATVGRDGKAKCRPFMFCFEKDGKLWFCTNNTKDVYKDMLANPEIEVSVSSPEYAWIRLHGTAVFENNKEVKEACMANPIVKGQYETAENPIFKVFYLDNPHGVIADFSGNAPYEF